jgi:hypothetical protein
VTGIVWDGEVSFGVGVEIADGDGDWRGAAGGVGECGGKSSCAIAQQDADMRDALLFEVIDYAQQVLTESLQHVDVEPARVAATMAQGLDRLLVPVGEDRPREEPEAVADLHGADELDDVRVA